MSRWNKIKCVKNFKTLEQLEKNGVNFKSVFRNIFLSFFKLKLNYLLILRKIIGYSGKRANNVIILTWHCLTVADPFEYRVSVQVKTVSIAAVDTSISHKNAVLPTDRAKNAEIAECRRFCWTCRMWEISMTCLSTERSIDAEGKNPQNASSI
jgi:hypothetical protein